MVATKIKDLLPSEWPVNVGDLPATNVEAIGIIEFDGYFNTMYLGMPQTATLLQPLVKIVGRSTSYAQGEFWMDRSKEILNGAKDEANGILSITMVGTPSYLGRSDQKFHEFQIVFQVHVKE